MNREELTREAIKYAVDYPTSYGKGYKHKDLRIAYLAGAEPREKRITDLEAQLKLMQDAQCTSCTDLGGLQQKIRKLEKENAELKEKYDTCLRENTGLKIHSAYVEKKLTKAKEIISEFVEWAN